MSPIGISTQKSSDVVSFTMVDAEEMKIVLPQKMTVKTVAERRKLKNHALKHHAENPKNHNRLKRHDKLRDLRSVDKKKAVCCLMREEAAVNNTEDSTTIEAMEFVASLLIVAAMEMKTISRHLKNANSFVTMPLECVI